MLRKIRTHEATKGMWVASMSTQAEAMERDPSMEFRADVYAGKPFNPSDLVR